MVLKKASSLDRVMVSFIRKYREIAPAPILALLSSRSILWKVHIKKKAVMANNTSLKSGFVIFEGYRIYDVC